jgi:hypothetical protein
MQEPNVWVVMQYREGNFDFQGVFNSEKLAVAACRTELYVVIPATINEEHPHEELPQDDPFVERQYYPLE